MGMILRIASSRIVGQGDIVGRSGYFSLNLSANSVMRGRLDARRTLKSLVADLRLSMKLTHMNSPWTNQLNAVNGRAQLVPINPNKVYEDGTMWYNDVSNVMVANPGASIPRATINDPNDNDRISDRYIEDGSYIRLKNISLGYTFPKKTIDKLGLSNLRIYANIQNLLTITGYDGYDPEIGASTSSVNVYGLDNGRYPSPTVYSFGLNVSF